LGLASTGTLPDHAASLYHNDMISGFARLPDGTVQAVGSVKQAAEIASRDGVVVWIDFEDPSDADLHDLGEAFQLDKAALEDCLYGEQRPRIDEYENYIFLVLYGMVGPEERDVINPRKLAAFCGARFLITAHREALRTIRTIRGRCERHALQLLSRSADFLLYTLIDGMVDNYLRVAEEHEMHIEALEEASLAEPIDDSILTKTVTSRRELIDLRQLAVSQRDLLAPIAKGEFDYISESLEQRFSHVHDHLTTVIEQIDGLRERLNGVRENYHAALADRTNAIIKTLTLFATVLLPLSVVTGIYGMNLWLWPSPESPIGFWGVLGAMFVLAAALLFYFRRRYWL
jgi:magnesium transporter